MTPLYFGDASMVGGGERYPTNLARGVAASSGGECAVDLISYGDIPAEHVLAPGVTLRIIRATAPPSNPLDVLSWELPAAIEDADLVHVHQVFTRSSEVAVVVASQQRKALCVTDHGGATSYLGRSLGMLELVNRVTCYSRFAASLLATTAPIEIIRGGVDGSFFTPAEHQPPRDRVLYVGRLLPHKGIDRLIAALPPELPLSVCGRPYHDDYFVWLQALARGKRVEFLTETDDSEILELYRRSWATVLPSVYRDCYGTSYPAPELMGFSLLESMACGTPAVCSRVAAMPEFVHHGQTGYVYDSLDQLSQLLRELAGDPELVQRLGRQGRRVIEEELDLTVSGARMLDVYHTVLRESS